MIVLCAVLCGADNCEEITEFGRANETWFRTFLELPHGIPSQDTFLRFFACVNPDPFRRAFIRWVDSFRPAVKGKQIAVDGKTLRRLEVRTYWHSNDVGWFADLKRWQGLAGFGMMESNPEGPRGGELRGGAAHRVEPVEAGRGEEEEHQDPAKTLRMGPRVPAPSHRSRLDKYGRYKERRLPRVRGRQAREH